MFIVVVWLLVLNVVVGDGVLNIKILDCVW